MNIEQYRRKVLRNLKKNFIQTPKKVLKIKINDNTRIIIDYMYGNRYCVHKQTKGNKPVLIEMLAEPREVADIIYKIKQEIKNPKLTKLKSLIK